VVSQADVDAWCRTHVFRGLPAPAKLLTPPPLTDLLAKDLFDVAFQDFLRSHAYATVLGWQHDLNWRLTGPYVGTIGNGLSYGVHPAVRVYYSLAAIDWLCSDRASAIPDGAMIIKEMHPIDAALNITLDANQCMQIQADVSPTSWTVIIKASHASQDGWYWANYTAAPQPPVAAYEIGNPPIFDRSAITSRDFYGDSPHPTEPNPLWYPTGAATDLGQELTYTGNFITGPANELYGPYENTTIVPRPMEHALGITPLLADQITSANLCGSCHNVLLPVFDNAGNLVKASYEQSTHLEWTNSDFAPGRANFRSCQDCHMPTQFKGQALAFQIANIDSSAFAPTTHRLPNHDITLTERDRYLRHALHGLNVFLNEMFQQFPLILGARQIDYMTGTATVPSLITGRNSMLEMAKQETASVDIPVPEKTADGKLRVVVLVTNKTGHYLPSGVGFRRVFLEFLVRDAAGNLLWASGRTDDLGAIVDGITDQVLASEQPVKFPDVPFQPHYQTIERGDQVQIYQELIEDSAGHLTTSFLRRFKNVKNNRIRPKGFDPAVFANNPSPFIQELAELPGAERFDPYYTDPQLTGADQIEYVIPLDAETLARVDNVRVSLYNQSIPPFYLQERFRDANRGPGGKNDIQRLYHVTSHLDVNAVTDDQGQPVLQNWKLLIAVPQTWPLE
jgi:hypothetical protein